MSTISLTQLNPSRNAVSLHPGDTVKVSAKIVEGDKERTQVFQGVVLKVKQGGAGPILTVRRVTYGIGVERTFPLNSPRVEKVEVVRLGKTRRARLYYLRGLSARAARIKELRAEERPEEEATPQPTAPPETTPPAA